MKPALHFATKLNSRDIQKCNCFQVPSYDLFATKVWTPAPNHKFVDPPLGLMNECSFSFSGRLAGLVLGVWGERQLRCLGFWETAYLPSP